MKTWPSVTHLDATLDNHVELASVLDYTGLCHHSTESSSASGGAPSCHDTEGKINNMSYFCREEVAAP